LLFHVLARQIKPNEKTLVEYLQFHLVISVEDLVVMCKKVMEKATKEVIRETHCKEREENKVRKFATCFIVDGRASYYVVIKSARANFEYWFVTIVKGVR
jgi:hypothetical protein